jgi:hypothetical protein
VSYTESAVFALFLLGGQKQQGTPDTRIGPDEARQGKRCGDPSVERSGYFQLDPETAALAGSGFDADFSAHARGGAASLPIQSLWRLEWLKVLRVW